EQSAPLGEQTTGFSYQGSLKNAGAPANGTHDFEFRLWDSASGGAQVGATVSLNGVAVTNGIFAVTLDFGNQYPDAFRFLEVRVRPTGGGAFTTLAPREQIKAVPYAVKSLNTEQLGGVAASQYVTTTTGAANFIQNTTTPQASSNFNISGNGTIGQNLAIASRIQMGTPTNGCSAAGGIGFAGSLDCQSLAILADFSNTVINRPSGGRLFFREANQDNMVIASGGNVGIGLGNGGTPNNKLHVIDAANTGLRVQTNTPGGTVASFGGFGSFQVDAQGFPGGRFRILENGNVAIGTPNSNSPGKLDVYGNVGLFLAGGGSTQVCQNATDQLSTCSSSMRYKTNIGRFSQGLSFVNKLHPISFDWKDGGMRDVGFGAEDIAKIDPRFVTYNSKGEVEGVKYDRLSVAFVNAFKEQQAEINELRTVSSEQTKKLEDQKAQIEQQQKQLDALKKLVCAQNPTAEVCKEEK
ncbi:MAG: tail fiber domain-containing protein, partial [Pyrinomonadaceae bacterium]